MYWSQFSYLMGVRQERIWYMKSLDGEWTEPRVAPFSGQYRDGQPSFSPDGKRIFFSSVRPTSAEDTSSDANIWFVEKSDTGWDEPEPLDLAVNTDYQEWFPTTARSGNIYYGFYQPGATESWDIYFSTYADGKYGKPERMGASVNNRFYEATPFVDPDERFIIFHSSRPGGSCEGGELCISFRKQDGTWTAAENLGARINTAVSRFPNVSLDGKYFFFTNLDSGIEDIYWVDANIIEELKPEGLN
jgi:Tol biopolymer transport system component